jgi:transposase
MSNRRAGSGGGESGAAEHGRWSSRRKAEVVLRLVRGEDLDSVSRELGVTAAMLARWPDEFLAADQASLRTRQADLREDEIARMKSKIGEITMENELLRERARRAEPGHPFVIAEVEAVSQIISPSADKP